MNTRTRAARTVGAAMLAGLAAVSVAACGSDDEQPAGPAAAEQAPDPAAAPEQVTWQKSGPVSLPVSTTSGPKVTTPAPSGFEQSGPGAGLAAVHAAVRIAVAPDGQWTQVVKAMVAPGPGRDAFMVNRAQLENNGAETNDDMIPVVRGWVMQDYSPERAQVQVITEYSDGSLLGTEETVIWRDGDWKLVIPEPESTENPQTALEQLPENMTVVEEPA